MITDTPASLVPLVVVLFLGCLTFTVLIVRAGLYVGREGVVVRGEFRAHRLAWEEVAGFHAKMAQHVLPWQHVVVEHVDGRQFRAAWLQSLKVTNAPTRIERLVEQLNAELVTRRTGRAPLDQELDLSEAPDQTTVGRHFRSQWLARLSTLCSSVVMFLGFGGLGQEDPGAYAFGFGTATFGLVMAVRSWSLGLSVDPSGVTRRGYFRHETFPWSSIRGFRERRVPILGWQRLVIDHHSDEATAWGLASLKLGGRRTRIETVVELLNAELQRSQTDPSHSAKV